MDKDKIKRNQQILAFAFLPFVLALPPIFGWAIGKWLDDYFKTDPYLMFLFLGFGIVSGIRECFRIIKRFSDGI